MGVFSKLADFASALANARVPAKPYSEQGVAGFGVYGGYVSSPERNPRLAGPNKWVTAADMLSNVSIIAASVRYTLNLISRPKWKADPPSDKQEAKDMAEFVEEVINGIDTSWSRIIRRSALYRFHGFNLQEWVATKRDDGKIGIASLDQRPVHTISKWDVDENGGILGVIQVSPQTGKEIYLPRSKLVYLVDDALTDRPDGLGWMRQLAEPSERLRKYLKLETMGFERDLAGIPIGRAPLQRIEQLVTDGKLQRKDADAMIRALQDFVSMQAKEPSTGLVLDSEPFRAKTESGETIASVMQWGMELLTGQPGSIAALGEAIHRLMMDMALVMGTDSILIGGRGQGSRALSEDKSRNLYLTANSTLNDMAEAYDRDIVTPLWAMNGFPDDLRPKLTTEDVAFKDAATIAQALAEMATAGAILHPNDPAINDLRQIMGISDATPVDETTADLMLESKAGLTQPDPNADPNAPNSTPGGDKGRPSRENPGGSGGGKDPTAGRGQAKKYDPDQPRDYHGRWSDVAGGVPSNPLNDDEKLFSAGGNEKVGGITIRDMAGGWHISDLRSITRGGGREAMQQVTELADAHGKTLSLFAVPGDSPAGLKMSKAKLKSWYEGFGFKVDGGRRGGDFMVRQPNQDAFEALGRIAGEGRNSDGTSLIALKDYDPNEARDDHGRWTDGGVGGDLPQHPLPKKFYPKNLAELRAHPAVESVDDGRPHDSIFVSLAPGFYWSEQRSFGTETVGESLRLMRGVYWQGEGPPPWEEAVTKYSPDEPRDYHGRWTDGGGGVVPWTRETKVELIKANEGKTVQQMRADATTNQKALDHIGAELEDKGIASYEPPPAGYEVKSEDSVMRKMRDEGYAAPHHITDYSRASFVIDHPEDADKVMAELQARGNVYDKGWQYLQRTGYLDRKVYLQHPNGGLSEIQITPRGVFQIKMGQGHKLYEVARMPSTPKEVAVATMRKSRALYAKALSHTPFTRFVNRAVA